MSSRIVSFYRRSLTLALCEIIGREAQPPDSRSQLKRAIVDAHSYGALSEVQAIGLMAAYGLRPE